MNRQKFKSISRSPDPSKSAVERFWNENVHNWKVAEHPVGTQEYFEEIEAYRYEKLDYLADAVSFERFAERTVLDVGCGVANDLSRFARAGAIVTGVDICERSISLATDNFRIRGLQGDFQKMDGENLEFPDDNFDAVFCHTVLHFSPDPASMIAEIHRVLKPGGEAIIMTINRHSWMILLHRLINVELDYLDAPVYFIFSQSEFLELLKPFSDVRIIPHRFPVPTRIHKGLKAKLYNSFFVGTFNSLPRASIRWTGHHLMAYVTK